MRPTLSGFLIVRDAVVQGYPFIEAARAALPMCDELLIEDGLSSDDTWRGLLALREAYPEKVRLFRAPWPGAGNRGRVLAEVTNRVRHRCRGDYAFSLQANEIVHEASLPRLAEAAELYPRARLFRFAYHNLMGSSLVWMTDFRRRLFRNLPHLESLGDAYDVGVETSALLRRPAHLLEHLAHGPGEHVLHLPEPVYRYRALFPENFLVKLQTIVDRQPSSSRAELEFARRAWQQTLREGDSPDGFWQRMRGFLDQQRWANRPDIPTRCAGEVATAPAAIAHLLHRARYDLDASLARL